MCNMTEVILSEIWIPYWESVIYFAQYHPDVNKQEGAEEKFKEISNAYEVPASKFYLRYV